MKPLKIAILTMFYPLIYVTAYLVQKCIDPKVGLYGFREYYKRIMEDVK